MATRHIATFQVTLSWNGSNRLSGLIVKCLGIPDIYDYERLSHASGIPQGIAQRFVEAQKLAKFVDGYSVPTDTCFEPIAVPYCKEFYQKRGQEIFTVGMQAPEDCWTNGCTVSPTNEAVKSFLDNVASSLFFPIATPELIKALVNTLLDLEKPFPFIFALGSRLASLPKALIDRVNSSGKGLVCAFWVEQRAIIQHEAIRWFPHPRRLRVPQLASRYCKEFRLSSGPLWRSRPLTRLLSSGPNPVAIELIQVRTGPQLAPSLREGPNFTGTIQDASEEFRAAFFVARGPRGMVLTENARQTAKAVREGHAGEASEEILRLVKF